MLLPQQTGTAAVTETGNQVSESEIGSQENGSSGPATGKGNQERGFRGTEAGTGTGTEDVTLIVSVSVNMTTAGMMSVRLAFYEWQRRLFTPPHSNAQVMLLQRLS